MKHVGQPGNNKLSYTVASCWSFSYIIYFPVSLYVNIFTTRTVIHETVDKSRNRVTNFVTAVVATGKINLQRMFILGKLSSITIYV